MILVTGATGNVGSEVATALTARGEEVRAVVRNPDRGARPEGVEVVRGDLDLPESLASALDGARGVFLLGGLRDMPGLLRQVERSGVEHVVLLTSRCVVGGKPDNAISRIWLDSEAAVRESGAAWTILRPGGFQSNALRWLPQTRSRELKLARRRPGRRHQRRRGCAGRNSMTQSSASHAPDGVGAGDPGSRTGSGGAASGCVVV